MCLIITGNANQIVDTLTTTPELLKDIYTNNQDGIGIMYTEGGKVRVHKTIVKNTTKALAFLNKFMPKDDRQTAIHFRLATHGDHDLANCHPYEVVKDSVYMMHNGILSHGNAKDITKSDTWHYVESTIKPLMREYPTPYLNPTIKNLIEKDITGSNRFVFLDDQGNLEIYNEDTGLRVEGLWFSNTYAWDAGILVPEYRTPRATWWQKEYTPIDHGTGWADNTVYSDVPLIERVADDFEYCLNMGDFYFLVELLEDYLGELAQVYCEKYIALYPEGIDETSHASIRLLTSGSVAEFRAAIKAHTAEVVADLMLNYLVIVEKGIEYTGGEDA